MKEVKADIKTIDERIEQAEENVRQSKIQYDEAIEELKYLLRLKGEELFRSFSETEDNYEEIIKMMRK